MGLPMSVYPGTYTPGSQTALELAVTLCNETWAQANTRMLALTNKIDEITNQTTGWLSTAAAPHISSGSMSPVTVPEPVVNIPTNIDTSMIYADFATQYNAIRALITSDLPTVFSNYFPEDMLTYTAAEGWVQAAMANPNSGLPAAVQAQLIADDHSRVLAESVRASDAVVQTFAARRFPMPPGAAASAVLQIQQKAQDLMAESSRKITLQCIDAMKFAIDEAMKMRQMAIGSALDWAKTMVAAPDEASKVIGIGIDAQSKLIHAVSSYYGARTAAMELTAKINEFNIETALTVSEKNQAADMNMIENRLKAILTEIQAFAQVCTALYNNLHTGATAGYQVNV